MTSKEALKSICLECEREKGKNKIACPFRSISNEYCEKYDTIEKDLEVLEKYRKIGEEIGIDLIKAVELCKQVNSKKVIYIKDEWGTYPIKILDNLDVELFNHRLYKNVGGVYVSLDLYEYGKTWALTKEELENDN